LSIEGMTCASCVGRVEKSLRAVTGVEIASVNLATERADVIFSAPADYPALVDAIQTAGFDVPERRSVELAIGGMTCASCVGRVENALLKVPGVEKAAVNLATERAFVQGAAGPEGLIAAVDRKSTR